ncbi:hypothetical protein D9758_013298 [Tetrapyrgos nigripes]|uniref:DAGKc domain-containing protein n=1 Tax=Tetrapyrgos nigripes TaxID=182062 RepID=A0A8H5FK31_9AGAR|nr:hypothetical protein D9758_013298 [Tetrapyrgos nigripes]
MAERELTVDVTVSDKPVKITLNKEGLWVVKQKTHEVSFQQVVAAEFHRESRKLHIAYAYKEKQFSLVELNGQVTEDEDALRSAMEFAEALHEKAYQGVKYGRRLKILVNPHGGQGKGVIAFKKQVEPLLKAAGCTLDVSETTHNGHAYDVAKSLELNYDAVVTVSGDGLIHEVLNGFANHKEPLKALAIPVAPIPTGSGNGLSLNLLGLENAFDIVNAALNVVKGNPMQVDVFAVTQRDKRSISFMSQAIGLMADIDIGTEHLRWMGDTRFTYGVLKAMIKFKPCDVELSYKGAEMDKEQMFNALKARHNAEDTLESETHVVSHPPALNLATDEDKPASLPELKYSMDDTEGWTTFDEKMLYLYAGKGPFVGRDLMAFPVSLPDDGLIDICVQSHSKSSRLEILGSFEGAPRGEQYWLDSVCVFAPLSSFTTNCLVYLPSSISCIHYVKASAYRVKPRTTKGCLSIDGEAFPFEPFQVEVLPRLATLLSPHGYYVADFHGPKDKKGKGKVKEQKGKGQGDVKMKPTTTLSTLEGDEAASTTKAVDGEGDGATVKPTTGGDAATAATKDAREGETGGKGLCCW